MKNHTTILVPMSGPVYTVTGLTMADTFLRVVRDKTDTPWVEIHEDCIREEHLILDIKEKHRTPMQQFIASIKQGLDTLKHISYRTSDYASATVKYQVVSDDVFVEHHYYIPGKDVMWYHMEHWVPMIKGGI